MAKLTVEEQPEYKTLPADSILLLKVDEMTEKEVDGANGKWVKLEIKFKVLGIQAIGDGSPVEDYESIIAGPIWGDVPLRLTDNPENKLRLWAEAILGVEMGLGFQLDTDVFAGREVRGITSTYNKRTNDPKTGQPFQGHKITALLPKASQQWQQQAPQAAPQQVQQAPAQTVPQQQYVGAPAGGATDPLGRPANDPWAPPQGFGDDEPPF